MEFKKACQRLLKQGKTITDGKCRLTIENEKFLVVEYVYKLDKLNFRTLKRFMPSYVYDTAWEWEEDYGGGSTWEVVHDEDM